MALVMVVIIVGVAVVLACALLSSSTMQAQVTGNLTQSSKAECLAESGIRLGMYYLQNPLKAPGGSLNSDGYWPGATGINLGAGAPGRVDVVVTRMVNAPGRYKIAASGRLSSKSGMTHASSAVIQFPLANNVYGASAVGSITLGGGAIVDSYDSRLGAYVTGNKNATLASNGNISLNGSSTIFGDALPGPGMTVSGGVVTGSTTPLASPLSLPPVTAGAYATTNDNAKAGSNINAAGDLVLPSGTTSTLPGGTYYIHDFNTSGTSVLDVTGPVTIYMTGSLSLAGKVKTAFDIPSNLNVRVIGSGSISISGQANYYMNLYAPQSDVKLSGNANFFGAVAANTLTVSVQPPGGLHIDEALVTQSTSQVGGPIKVLSYAP